MIDLQTTLLAGLAALGGAIIVSLGRWIPALLHRGRMAEIKDAITDTNSERIKNYQRTSDDLKLSVGALRDDYEMLRTSYIVLEKLREEDKGVLAELRQRMTRLEERLDERLTIFEKKFYEQFNQFQSSIIAVIKNDR